MATNLFDVEIRRCWRKHSLFRNMRIRLTVWFVFLVSFHSPYIKLPICTLMWTLEFPFKHYEIIINESLIYSKLQSDVFCCEFVNATTNEAVDNAEALTAVCYRMYVNTLIPTLFQTKSFNFWFLWSQSPETTANIAITLRTIIGSMLVLVPAIHVNDMQIAFTSSSPSHSEHSYTQLWHRLFSHSFFWLKADRHLFFVYKCVQCLVRTIKKHTKIKHILSETRLLL